MVMALRPEASAPSARAVLAGSGGRSVATMAAEVYTCKPQLFRGFNLFAQRFYRLRRPRAMADPSTAAARLQVLGMSCDLTGSLPATRLHSDRSGFDRLDCTGTECCLTDDAPHALLEATKFNAGFTCMRVYHDPPSWSRPMRVCLRSEAPWHAAEEASSPCVPPATMRLLGIAHLARDRLPRPEASTRPSSLRPGG